MKSEKRKNIWKKVQSKPIKGLLDEREAAKKTGKEKPYLEGKPEACIAMKVKG